MSAQPKFNSRGPQVEELDDFKPVSILGKRKFNNAFHEQTFDDARYGQHISSDFFEANVGHSVIERKDDVKIFSNKEEQDILQWCQNYLTSKNK
jgi:hypothetical protein